MTTISPVSVIIPAFNCADTLARAVESVIRQTTPPAEIIIVDDASTDNTWQEICGLNTKYGDAGLVSVRLERNQGPGDARNRGWDLAGQEFIAFLDADDAWHPRKLEIQHRWMVQHPHVVLSGHRSRIKHDEREGVPEIGDFRVTWFSAGKLLMGNPFSTPTMMVRRAVPERFKPGKRYSEDYLLWLMLAGHHGEAACLELPLTFLYKARYGAGGLSGRLWEMEKGELDTYRECQRQGIISQPNFLFLAVFSLLKFMRRLLMPSP